MEKRINIRASDYKFTDKKKYYQGFSTTQGVVKVGTRVVELQKMVDECDDFSEQDIHSRQKGIIDGFIAYLRKNGLLQ